MMAGAASMSRPMARPRKVTIPRQDGVAVGYVRVSTAEQATSGLGLDAQCNAIGRECERRSWVLARTFEDAGISGKSMLRPALQDALDVLEAGEASILVVAKLDRLTRSLGDLCVLMDRAIEQGWAIVASNLSMDMTTPMGRAMAQVAGVFAELERELIAQRTRDALAVKRAQGVTLGRPSRLDPAVRDRILTLRGNGLTFSQVARALEKAGVTTPLGAPRWNPGSLARICARTAEASS